MDLTLSIGAVAFTLIHYAFVESLFTNFLDSYLISSDVLFSGHKLPLFSKNMNIFNLTLLINIHSKNYKKESPKSEKIYRKNTNDSICYLEFILLCSSVTVYHSPNMENLQHLPCYLININPSDNVENIANLSTQPLNSYQNLMVLIYLLFL